MSTYDRLVAGRIRNGQERAKVLTARELALLLAAGRAAMAATQAARTTKGTR